MRRNYIFTGILLILSIIGFALAAPVSVQEKRHTLFDVAHIPKDVINVLGKRGMDLEMMWKKAHSGNLAGSESGSSATYTSSGSESDTDQGSTNVVRPLVQNAASSSGNPNPLMKYSSSLPNLLAPPAWGNRIKEMPVGKLMPGPSYKGGDGSHWTEYTPSSSGYGSDQEFTEAHIQKPNHPLPSADSVSPTDSDLDLKHWTNLEDLPPATELSYPEHQSSSKDYQPADRLEDHLLAAIYAVKGKAKELLRISGTARDVGDAPQREF
jgi:hypothetical protein